MEKYLKSIYKQRTVNFPDFEISESVKKMVGVDKPTPDFDHKKEYQRHIIEKYSK